MFYILVGIQRIDTTKESAPMIMEFGGMVDIIQRFAVLVRESIPEKKDLFLVPTDYHKRESDSVAYIVGSDSSVYRISVYLKKYEDNPLVYKKVPLKEAVDEDEFAMYLYKLGHALTHAFTPSAFSTIPGRGNGDHHCNCNHDYDYDKQKSTLVPSPVMDEERKKYLRERNESQCSCGDHCDCHKEEQESPYTLRRVPKPITSSSDIIGKRITDRNEIAAIMEEDAECDSKFRPKFLG
jgi:hypothetical protein